MRYIVFLRAINVGGHVVTMAELKKIFVSMGFKSAETFIASGNVIIESKSPMPLHSRRRSGGVEEEPGI